MSIQSYLQDQGVNYEMHTHPQTFTAQGLADAEHVTGYAVAKAVIVKGRKGFSMCVLAAPKHADLGRVAAALGEKEVRLATESEMEGIFQDCELGAEPPIGAVYGLPTLVDENLRGKEFLVIPGGTHTQAIKLRGKDYERVCQGKFADFTCA